MANGEILDDDQKTVLSDLINFYDSIDSEVDRRAGEINNHPENDGAVTATPQGGAGPTDFDGLDPRVYLAWSAAMRANRSRQQLLDLYTQAVQREIGREHG